MEHKRLMVTNPLDWSTTMSAVRKLLFVTITILSFVAACVAQESQSPCMQIENGIRVNAATWRLVRKSATCNRNLSYLKYQFGKSLVFVFIFPQKSLEEAAEAFDYRGTDEEFYSRKVEVLGSGWRNSKEKNRVWKAWSGETGVDLKKGKVVVRVSASTLNLSRQFGQYVGDALPDT